MGGLGERGRERSGWVEGVEVMVEGRPVAHVEVGMEVVKEGGVEEGVHVWLFFFLGLLSRGVKDPEVGCLVVVECVL